MRVIQEHRRACRHLQAALMRKESNQSGTGKQTISISDLRVWGEINYLDSATDYRECLTPPAPRPCPSKELEFLDDQINFPWLMIVKFVSLAAAVCILLLIITSHI